MSGLRAGANEVVAKGDVDQQIALASHSYIADFQIGTTVALAREHPLAAGGVAGGLTDGLPCRCWMSVVLRALLVVLFLLRERANLKVFPLFACRNI